MKNVHSKKSFVKLLIFCFLFVQVFGIASWTNSNSVFAASVVIPQSQMTATATSQHGGNEAGKAIDGNISTFWHSEWDGSAPLPESITLNLGGTYNVFKVRYQPRTEYTGVNGIITSYVIYTSTDGTNFTQRASGTWSDNTSEKTVTFSAVNASHIRLEAVAGCGDLASAAEINIEYDDTPTPSPTPTHTPTPTPAATPTPTPYSGPWGTVPQNEMTATATSTQSGYNAVNAIDGNTGTYWYSNSTDSLPQSITLYLGGIYDVSKIRYLPRSEYNGVTGTITSYRIYFSTNGTDFTQVASGTWANSIAEKLVKIAPTSASYVRLEAVAGADGRAAAKEINIDYGINPTEPVKLTLTPEMVIDEQTAFRGQAGGGVGYATMLVDEQAAAGDPPSGSNCVTNWNPAYDASYYPASAYIDLGRNYKITKIYLYDMSSQGNMNFYTGAPFNWSSSPFLTDPLVGYGTWNERAVDVETRYLRIERMNGAGMNELVLYGYPVGDAPAPTPTPVPHVPSNITVDQAIGANVHFTSSVDKMAALGHVREYHPWMWDEGDTNTSYPGYPNNQNKYNPAWAGGGTWNFDSFYQNVKNAGVMLYSCIMQSVPWISGSPTYYKDKPIYTGEDPADPASYAEHADKMFQSAARYGSTAVADNLLKLAPDQQRLTGLNLIKYYENWNEPNQTFNEGGRKGYFHPYELAAMTSADYDGHEGTMGNTVGVKNADPNAKLVMAGLMDTEDMLPYLKNMREWFYYNRTDHEFAADVINIHYYCSDGTKGISPEAKGMKNALKEIVDYSHLNMPNREVWLTEFGWDTGIGYTAYYAPSMEAQGQWLVRAYMAAFAAGIDRASMFMLHDAKVGGTGTFDSCGLLTGDTAKPSWYYVYTMKETLQDMVFDSEVASGNPNVYIYKFRSLNGTTNAYAVWCPTSNGTTVNGYQLNIGGYAGATLTTMQEGYTNGIQTELTASNGKVTVNVGERPIFVTVGQQAEGLQINGPANVTIPVAGQTTTQTYSVFFKDQNGAPMVTGPYTWTVADMNNNPVSTMAMGADNVLTVLAASAAGNYKIKATATENPSWFSEKIITLAKAASVVTRLKITGDRYVTANSMKTYQIAVTDQYNVPMPGETVTWSVMDEESQPITTMTFDEAGVLTIDSDAAVGIYIIKATSTTDAAKFVTKVLIIQ